MAQKSCQKFGKSVLPCFAYGDQKLQIKHESPCKMLMTLLKLGQLVLRSHEAQL